MDGHAATPATTAPRTNAPFFYLRPDEAVLLHGGAAPGYAWVLFLVFAAVPTLLALGLGVALPIFVPEAARFRAPVAGGWLVLVALAGLLAWRRQATSEFAVTDARIYARTGRLVTSVRFTTYDKVTDLHYRQGPLERLAGVSRITFDTAGGDVTVAGVRDALAIKAAAEAARDAFVHHLLEAASITPSQLPRAAEAAPLGEAPAEATPEPLPAWTGPTPPYVKSGDTVAWMGRPRLVAALGALTPLLGFAAIATLSGSMRGIGAVAYIVAAVLLVAVGARVLQLQRTEYLATDRRVYARSGILGTTVRQLTYDKITDITYRQDLWGRLLGYGAVSLATAGGQEAAITLNGLGAPLKVKEDIEALRARYLREGRA